MNAVTFSLRELNHAIPKEILQIAFGEQNDGQNKLISIDEMIMVRVIRPRVLVDCDIVGGQLVYIELAKCEVYQSGLETIVYVPKTLTNNRSIISALEISLSASVSGSAGNSSSGVMGNEAMKLMDAASSTNLSTARLSVIGENRILIQGMSVNFNGLAMAVSVAHDDNLSQIPPRAYNNFSKLVTLAVKAYIHNYLIIKLGEGFIYSGHTLTVVSNIVERYEDANEEYLEYLRTDYQRSAFLSDSLRTTTYITGML